MDCSANFINCHALSTLAINEAIELAKAFNDEKDAKFINAILTKIGE